MLSHSMKALFSILTLCLLLAYFATTKAQNINDQRQQQEFVQELENFVRIFSTIKQGYVDDLEHKELFEKAIKGMMSQLDPHSSYLEPKEQEDLLETSSGKFGGLGIVISLEDGLVKIISPIDDTPAYRAGLQAGDFIIKINQTSVRGLSLEESVNMMRGNPGTKVIITVLRQGEDPFEVEMTRDIITIVSVRGYLLEKDIAYLRISSFQMPTAKLLQEKIEELITRNQQPLKGIVLDLRNNPGGLLHSAVEVADLFLDDKGLIVSTKGRIHNSNIEYKSTVGDILKGTPIVVLINKGTASAAEIVSGALQDYKRAIILGEKSFGKGSVQTVSALSSGYGLKLTTARYYTPSDRSIQAKGIQPDVVLEDLKFNKEEKEKLNFRESEKDLKRHIKNGDVGITVATSTKPLAIKSEVLNKQEKQKQIRNKEQIEQLKQDYYIDQAINSLHVLTIWQ